jgi:hypothetical protein
MSDKERFWINKCRFRPDIYVITVDNDSAFITDIKSGDCVFEFEHFGWELALYLLRYIGCNAEEA